ncbi:MAG: alpha/beta fold hydrolase [Acidobacteriota bacterium]
MDSTIEPHFFGKSDRQLLGLYHRPDGRARRHGVVICPPAPQEYMRTHMAMRRLAAILSRDGFHVLRFDYYGTGDSAGGSSDGSLEEWQANIVSAIADLKDCSGVTKVSLVGLRLGAALAARAAVAIANFVLWDPVIKGSAYLEELRAIHQRRFADLLFPIPVAGSGEGGDLLGFPLSIEMEAEIRSVDVIEQMACRAEHIVLVSSTDQEPHAMLDATFARSQAGTAPFERHVVAERSVSDGEDGMLLSTQALQVIAAALSRRLA